MNISQKFRLKHTAAEETLLALMDREGAKAIAVREILAVNGLPTRRVERWHYTDLRSMMREFPVPISDDADVAKRAIENISSQFACVELPIVNGHYQPEQATTIPPNVVVGAQEPQINVSAIAEDDTIGLMNAALASEGLTISIGDNLAIEDKVSMSHVASGAGSSASCHNVIVGNGSSVVMVERHVDDGAAGIVSNVVCDLEIGDGALVTWIISQELAETTTRFGQLNVALGEKSELTILVLNAGGKLVRQEINVSVAGEGAALEIRGVNLIGENAHIDVTTRLDHLVPHTTAEEIFRNVVVGNGHGVFQGQINVAQPAQKTDAVMACNSLLLSDDSNFSAKPELEIFADDVQCGHGATVTDIDHDHLFYLRARGIPEKAARELLIKAFVEEVFESVEIEQVADVLNTRIESWLDKNG